MFSRGRHVATTRLRWFLTLRLVAALRAIRRSTLRYAEEQQRIEAWLDIVRGHARDDSALAAEIAATQELIKGYSDTFEHGLANFGTVVAAAQRLAGRDDAAEQVRALRLAALADEHGDAMTVALAAIA